MNTDLDTMKTYSNINNYTKWISVVVLFHLISGLINLVSIGHFLPILPITNILYAIIVTISIFYTKERKKKIGLILAGAFFLLSSELILMTLLSLVKLDFILDSLNEVWYLTVPHFALVALFATLFQKDKKNGILFFVALFIISQGVVLTLTEDDSYILFYLVIAISFWIFVGKTVDDRDSSVIHQAITAIHLIMFLNVLSNLLLPPCY